MFVCVVSACLVDILLGSTFPGTKRTIYLRFILGEGNFQSHWGNSIYPEMGAQSAEKGPYC